MSNQFAMVEELAFLVKDNLPCKHLVLSVEEALVNFLQDDSSRDEILELEPMNPYNRLLLHRLADIFGFAHESIGDGGDRHLILERCPETTIPSILVSDILWQYDEPQPLAASHQLLRRKDAPTVLIINATSCQHTFKEREAAYVTGRERIFAVDEEGTREPVTQRPRSVPVVARRMIAHALDQKIVLHNRNVTVEDCEGYEVGTSGLSMQGNYKICSNSSSEIKRACNFPQEQDINLSNRAKGENHGFCVSLTERKVTEESVEQKLANVHLSRSGRGINAVDKEYLEKEHLGAAKRIFAQALGRSSVKHGLQSKGDNSKESVPK